MSDKRSSRFAHWPFHRVWQVFLGMAFEDVYLVFQVWVYFMSWITKCLQPLNILVQPAPQGPDGVESASDASTVL
ncbi:hypothetical protein MPTK1_3g21860 [Marchantia polymorpha subsp. ruderalis]|uniref:Uncharacterized protein n=2 Tax=Marchantia polymorpha TaxID=3197 RepID=A0AAF6B3D6_MARPO|nr:hypothetical protein MARPO_0089s0030 [Marchantia polymorpha]BBN06520.1 hypothetical protein Mp_3g21860 [Marchantia polymorpha subsp. ruderalis]|eukprot:PTQ33398.1 hypothetical protein MARPO_0089s0030 [Marchantia polymorpha]